MEELVWIHVCLSPKPLSQLCFTAWIPLFKKNNFDVYILDEIIWEDILVRGYPGGAVVKNPPASTGDAASSLGWVNPLEKEITTYSSILAWKILWTEEPGRQYSMRSQRVGHMRWKYFLPYQWARNITAISDFWPSRVNEGFQNETQCLWPSRWHHLPWGAGRGWGGVGDAGGSHLPLSRWTRNRIWPQGVRGWDGWTALPVQWTWT